MASIVPVHVLTEYLQAGGSPEENLQRFQADAAEATEALRPINTELSKIAIHGILADDAAGEYDKIPKTSDAEELPLVSFFNVLGRSAYVACHNYLMAQTDNDKTNLTDVVKKHGKFVYWDADGTAPVPQTVEETIEGLAGRIARLTIFGALRWAPIAIATSEIARDRDVTNPTQFVLNSWRMAVTLAGSREYKENRIGNMLVDRPALDTTEYGDGDAQGIATGEVKVNKEFLVALKNSAKLNMHTINAAIDKLPKPEPNEDFKTIGKDGCYLLHVDLELPTPRRQPAGMEEFCAIITRQLDRLGYLATRAN